MYLRKLQRFLAAMAAVAMLAACSDDDDNARLTLEGTTLFVEGWGVTATMHFTSADLRSISLNSVPKGWTIEADLPTGTLTATSPAEADREQSDRSGTVSVIGYTMSGKSIIHKLQVGVVSKEDLVSRQANCMVLTSPYTVYAFDPTLRGESGEKLATAEVRIVWQTAKELVRELRFDGTTATFYIDGEKDDVVPGNALLGAYDRSGKLLTTWHLWLTNAADYGEQTYAGGRTFLTLNLGAARNANATPDEVLGSFGCFYQWGRKEPFVGPAAYDAADGADAKMYDANGETLYLTYEASSPETGTAEYAAAHPTTYILGTEASGYDWLHTPAAEPLWSGERKTANDPCPKGWRVPSERDFEALRIVDAAAGKESQYGWYLTDGTATAYYPGAGFRTYLTGVVQNMYNPVSGVEVPRPWTGDYWTAGTQGRLSSAFVFWFDAADPARSGTTPSEWRRRADGMQIRCVRE